MVAGPNELRLDAIASYKREGGNPTREMAQTRRKAVGRASSWQCTTAEGCGTTPSFLATGRVGYRIEVSNANRGLWEARVAFCLEAANGLLIGEAPVPYTGGKTQYVLLSGAVKPANRMHDLFIAACGR